MTSTLPPAGPGPDTDAAGVGVLGEPVARRRSRLRTYCWSRRPRSPSATGWRCCATGPRPRAGLSAGRGQGGRGGGAAVGRVAAGAAPEAESRSAETLAIETDASLRLVIGDVVTPIAEVVGRVHQTSGKGERESLRGQLKQLVVEAAASLCDGERARAVFFQLEWGEMRPAAWFGRGDPPTTVCTYDPADRRGQEALLLVHFHDYLLVDDARADELPGGAEPRPGAGYRSFISVSVFCGEQNVGMLSVDAPEPQAFDETDLNLTRAMAQLLGAGVVDRR